MKHFIVILLLFVSSALYAQQGLYMDFGEVDSTEIEFQRNIEYHQFINGTLNEDLGIEDFKLPKFDLLSSLPSIYTAGVDVNPQAKYIGGYLNSFAGPSPYLFNSEILSEAAYKLGDKFVVGGYSYGTNNMMTAPPPSQPGSYYDTYGSTMFMQYKVSKNIKIETSISVGQHNGPGF